MPIAAVHIAQSLQRALDSLIGFIPNLIGFLIILLIGYLIARVVRAIVSALLAKIGLDRALSGSPAGAYVERASPGARPSRLVGAVVFWFIFIYAISAAVGALKIPALTNFMANVQNYLPNVIAAVLMPMRTSSSRSTIAYSVSYATAQKMFASSSIHPTAGTIPRTAAYPMGIPKPKATPRYAWGKARKRFVSG